MRMGYALVRDLQTLVKDLLWLVGVWLSVYYFAGIGVSIFFRSERCGKG